ncbi:MAG: hypothetical protein ACLFRY_04725 [Spirochaetia bacterium]
MDLGMTVEILTQLGLGAVATFLAILLWSYTRDSAWMLVIIGIILKFGEVMYTTFELFGIVRPGLLVIKGVAVGKVVLLALPYIAFAAAFLVMILRSRVRIRTLSGPPAAPERAAKAEALEKAEPAEEAEEAEEIEEIEEAEEVEDEETS